MKLTALITLLSFTAFAQTADAPVAQSWYVQKDQLVKIPENGVLLNDTAAMQVQKQITDMRADNEKLTKDFNDAADVANSSFTPLTCVLIAAGALLVGTGLGVGVAFAVQKR